MANAIAELLIIFLSGNIMQFGTLKVLQLIGTAMGTSVGPAFANCVMISVEEEAFKRTGYRPPMYKRLLDDLFFVFVGTREELEEFVKGFENIVP